MEEKKTDETETAAAYVMPFGRYAGKTLWEISGIDPLWLDNAKRFEGVAGEKIRLAVMFPLIARRIHAAKYSLPDLGEEKTAVKNDWPMTDSRSYWG